MINDNIDSKFNKIAAQTIRKYREEKKLSLEEVSKKMKTPISRQSLYKYENNLARMKNNVFINICYAIGVDPNEIYNEINNKYIILSDNENTFSNRLNKAIELNNLTPSKFANKVDMDESFINDCLNGKIKPNSMNIQRFAATLNVSENWLKGNDEDEVEILYKKYKEILTDSDKAIIKTIIEQRIKEYNNGNISNN